MCSQSLSLSGSPILHHRFAFVSQRIFWIWTNLKRVAQTFLHHVSSKCPICWKHSRDDFSNLKSSGCITVPIGNSNDWSRKTVPSRKHANRVDGFGADQEGGPTRAISSEAIPTARSQDASSL